MAPPSTNSLSPLGVEFHTDFLFASPNPNEIPPKIYGIPGFTIRASYRWLVADNDKFVRLFGDYSYYLLRTGGSIDKAYEEANNTGALHHTRLGVAYIYKPGLTEVGIGITAGLNHLSLENIVKPGRSPNDIHNISDWGGDLSAIGEIGFFNRALLFDLGVGISFMGEYNIIHGNVGLGTDFVALYDLITK